MATKKHTRYSDARWMKARERLHTLLEEIRSYVEGNAEPSVDGTRFLEAAVIELAAAQAEIELLK